jgi:hypothetical protein
VGVKKPYGVRCLDILKGGVLGPFAPGIGDYEEQ